MLDPRELKAACERIRAVELKVPSVSKVDAYLLAAGLADLDRLDNLLEAAELEGNLNAATGLLRAKTDLLRTLNNLNKA